MFKFLNFLQPDSWKSHLSRARALPAAKGLRPATLDARLPVTPDGLQRILALDFSTYLPGSVLTKVDRASMAHGLEVRPPLLDNALVDWAFSLPSRYKLRHGARASSCSSSPPGASSPTRSSIAPRRDSASRSEAGCAVRCARASRTSSPAPRCGTSASSTARVFAGWNRDHQERRRDLQQAAVGAAGAGSLVPAQLQSFARDVQALNDQAEPEQGSPDRFGYEWSTYSTILPESKGQLERWLGPDHASRASAASACSTSAAGWAATPTGTSRRAPPRVLGRRHGRRQPRGRATKPGGVLQRPGREVLGPRSRSRTSTAPSIA